MDDTFIKNHLVTIGIDFKIKSINFEGKLIKLNILDTPGLKQFHAITKTYYKGTHGIIIVYDVTNYDSLRI